MTSCTKNYLCFKHIFNVSLVIFCFYRVRWKGYDVNADTWEPRDNLLSCEDLLNVNYIYMCCVFHHYNNCELTILKDECGFEAVKPVCII